MDTGLKIFIFIWGLLLIVVGFSPVIFPKEFGWINYIFIPIGILFCWISQKDEIKEIFKK